MTQKQFTPNKIPAWVKVEEMSFKEAAFTLMKEIYIDESYIKYLIENIEALEESKTDGSITFRQLLSKSFRKRFFIGILANWGQQSSGVDIIIFYSNKIFNNNISVFCF